MCEDAKSGENKGIKMFSKMIGITPGSIKPEGWLKEWTRINADGWLLQYAKNKDVGVYGKFWNRNETAANIFDENNQTLTLCDYTAYFADALVRYAHIVSDSKVAKEWEPWLKQLLASRDESGYIGAFMEEARWQHWLEIFSQSLVMDALIYHYEVTGDSVILDICEKAVNLIIQTWNSPGEKVNINIFDTHGTIVIKTALKLYDLTGKKTYLDFACQVLEKFGRVNEYLKLDDAVVHRHNVMETEHVGFPSMLYEYTGDQKMLDAGIKAWEMMKMHLCVDGTPHGGEMMSHVGSREVCEHCSAVEWAIINIALAKITGEVKYADAVEVAMFNGYPAAKTPDGMMVAYSHAPNQLVAAEWGLAHNNSLDSDWMSSRQYFSTAHEPLCCNSNGPRGIPHFVDSIFARTVEGLAIMYFGPCRINTIVPGIGNVSVNMETTYPFEDEIRITINPEKSGAFPLKIRIPAWCKSASLKINGEQYTGEAIPGTFAIIQREWSKGDCVTIAFDIPVVVNKTIKPEFGIRAAYASVQRGPLVYTLPVSEDWKPIKPPAHGPGQGIESCRIFMKEDAVWNYALIVDAENPEDYFKLEKLTVPADSKPWDNNPELGLKVKARRILNWHLEGDLEHPITPGAPYNPMKLSDEIETIMLVPYGCTRLHMTWLPLIIG